MAELRFAPAVCFLLCLAFLLPLRSDAVVNKKHLAALQALKQAWQATSLAWQGDPCTGSWFGITCDDTDTKVLQLVLPNQALNGNLPAAIGDLTDLTTLDLALNDKLNGAIPPEIGNLGNLQILALQYCSFSGKIPPEIGKLSALTFLSLKQNSLTGSIPSTIGKLINVDWFDVSDNRLSGSLPVSTTGGGLDTLINAQHFHLQDNHFSGNIPSEICNTNMSLIHLLLQNNSFVGSIPSNIGDLEDLNIMRLDDNNLAGPVPESINKLPTITAIQLGGNLLNGVLPNLTNLAHLQILSIQSANLTGEVPSALFSLANLTQVFLGFNELSGTLDLRNASLSLIEVDLQHNNISFANIGNYSQTLRLAWNPVCNLGNFPDNACTAALAPSPSPSASPLSSSPLAPSPALSPPLSDCTCTGLFDPNPTATSCMCSLPITGMLQFAAQNIPAVEDIIPYLKTSFFTGLNLTKPDQIVFTVKSSTQLKMSIYPFNNVSWDQTRSNELYHILSIQSIKVTTYGTYSFFVITESENSNAGLSTASKVGIGIGVVVLVIGVLMLGFYAVKQKKRADKAEEINKPFASWISKGGDTVDAPQLKGARYFSFTDLKRATSNFSKQNEIGVGGYGTVYKGLLPSGEQVAIKRAKAGSMQGVEEFKNEIELLSRVHHKNLVGLVGFCFEQGEQMLVYEYMPNGTLGHMLSGQNGQYLNWQMRVNIALGSAKGILYLHAEANPPIIHRDIKSSNILLDEKLVAKVADFGLSVLIPDSEEDHVSPDVKGTLGYLDPEYYTTQQLTEKSDVYSFGVVLLEILTAKPPISNGRYVVRDVRTALREGGIDHVQRLLDPNLTNCPETELDRFSSLALCCVKEAGSYRPTMHEIVKELEALAAAHHPAASVKDLSSKAFNLEEGSDYPSQTSLDTSFKYSGTYVFSNMQIEPK